MRPQGVVYFRRGYRTRPPYAYGYTSISSALSSQFRLVESISEGHSRQRLNNPTGTPLHASDDGALVSVRPSHNRTSLTIYYITVLELCRRW